MGSWQTWSSNSLGSAAVLKQEKLASVKKSKHRGETGTFSNILIRFSTPGM
jgi:hypothetical protein